MKTSNILLFLKSCVVGVYFKKYRQGPGGGGKDEKSLHLISGFVEYLQTEQFLKL